MRYRVTFVVGFATGYVLGARAGRERYEQVKKVSQRVAGHPAVQKAAGTVASKATDLGQTAKDKATEKMPGFAQAAMSKASTIPGLRGRVNDPRRTRTGPRSTTRRPPPGRPSTRTTPDPRGQHPAAAVSGRRVRT